jgi:SPOR domain
LGGDCTGKRTMARVWRRRALAVSTAAALGIVCALSVEAQSPPPKAAAKAKAKAKEAPKEEAEAPEEEGEEAPAKKPAKKAKQDPAQAQKTIDQAAKLLEAGKASEAAQSLTAVLSGGNLPPAIMARALLYRGIAYRQQKMPAQAIADLTSALWLKGGLTEAGRADALRQRASAYQEAGLAEGGGAVAAAVPNSSRGGTRTASADQGWTTATNDTGASAQPAPAPAQSSSGWSLGNAFAGLFGGTSSSSSPEPAPAKAAPDTTASIESPRVPAAQSSAPRPRTSAWSSNTEVSPATASAPTALKAAPAKPDGRFRIQVGMVRTADEAQALAAKVRREHGQTLSAREPEVDQAVVGNMGSFYRVRVGPYATQADGQAACAKLRGSGLDCMVVTQ